MKRFFVMLAVLVIAGLTACGSDDAERIAWAVGFNNPAGPATVLLSNDGGDSWTRKGENSLALQNFGANNLYVQDKQNIWVVGTNSTLVHSGDQGDSWEKVETFPSSIGSIEFYDISVFGTNDFWISGDHTILHSTDGAKTWKVHDLTSFGVGIVQGIKAITADVIYAVGSESDSTSGFVVRTLDGGQNWENVELVAAYFLDEGAIGVDATDVDHVTVSGGQGSCSEGSDGGKTWNNCSNNYYGVGKKFADINDLIMLDEDNWLAALDGDQTISTHDAGKSWSQTKTPSSGTFVVGIDAASRDHLLAVSLSEFYPILGYAFVSRDGGDTWVEATVPENTAGLNKVAFAP